MDKDLLERVSSKLDLLIALLIRDRLEDMRTDSKIILLNHFGVGREAIAFACKIKIKTVGENLSRLKNKTWEDIIENQ